MILLPDRDANTYATLKRAGYVAVGIPTLCVVSGDYAPKTQDNFYANLVTKFNPKAQKRAVNHMLTEIRKVPSFITMLVSWMR